MNKSFDFFPQGFVCLDLETTGLSPLVNKIVEIAGIKVTPFKTETFESLINPKVEIKPENIAIHGITNEMVKNAPCIDQVLPKFMEFVGDLPLVAHNAQFDLGFIVCSLHHLGIPFTHNQVFCTVKLSRLVFKEMEQFKLGYLGKKLNIEIKKVHRAEDDAQICRKILEQALLRANKSDLLHSFLFHLDDFQNMEKFLLKDHLLLIRKKIEGQEIMRIRYLGGSKKNLFRPIQPISLLPLPQGNVLYAYCLDSKIYKIYHLNKIAECAEPTHEDLQKYSKDIV